MGYLATKKQELKQFCNNLRFNSIILDNKTSQVQLPWLLKHQIEMLTYFI